MVILFAPFSIAVVTTQARMMCHMLGVVISGKNLAFGSFPRTRTRKSTRRDLRQCFFFHLIFLGLQMNIPCVAYSVQVDGMWLLVTACFERKNVTLPAQGQGWA